MKVIHENVLVKIPEILKEQNGVLLPDSDITPKREGYVLNYGEAVPEKVKELLDSRPKVEYKEFYDGSEITIEGVNYIVMNYKDILIIK